MSYIFVLSAYDYSTTSDGNQDHEASVLGTNSEQTGSQTEENLVLDQDANDEESCNDDAGAKSYGKQDSDDASDAGIPGEEVRSKIGIVLLL